MSAFDVMKMVLAESPRVATKLLCAPDVVRSLKLSEVGAAEAKRRFVGVEVVVSAHLAPGWWMLVDRDGRPVAKGQGAVP